MSALAPDSVPVNVDVPTPLFNATVPPGKAPDCKVIPVELVAVKLIVPMSAPPANVPNDPEPVVHVGTSTLTGTESGASADTTYNFTIRATDAEAQTADRAFSLTFTFNARNSCQFN